MVRIVLVNLVRSILLCAAAFVGAWAVDLGAAYFTRAVFQFEIPFWLCIVLSGFVSAAVFSVFMKWGQDTEAILPPTEEWKGSYYLELAARGKHVKFIAVWATLLIHLAVAAVAVVLYFQFGESLATLFTEPAEPYLHRGMYLTEALASVAVVQAGYFFAYWARFKATRCPSCKNVRCLVHVADESVKENVTYEFEADENKGEEVSFELDGTRYEGMGHKWYMHKKTSRQICYLRKCMVCGKISREYRYEYEKD